MQIDDLRKLQEMKGIELDDSVIGSPSDSTKGDLVGLELNNESPDLGEEKLEELSMAQEIIHSRTNEALNTKGIEGKDNCIISDDQNVRNLAPYNKFLVLLKDKICSEIVFFIAKFIQQYPHLDEGLLQVIYDDSKEKHELEDIIHKQEEIGTTVLANLLQSFVIFCGKLLEETKIFRKVANIDEEKIFIVEGLEKLVTTKLYNVLFEAVSFENDDADHYLFRKLKVLKTFVRLHHFDISKIYIETLQSDNLWLDVCKNELYKFIRVKSPKDKVVLIVNICKILLSYMNNINKKWIEKELDENNERIHSPPAADDLLPLLIYCIIQSNPTKIKAHVEFISLFRNPQLLVSEDLYFFTHFYSAITFLEKLDGRQIQLNIETSKFEELFKISEKKLFGNNLLHLLSPYSESRISFEEKQNRIQEIISELSLSELNYKDVSTSDELKVGDIPKFFNEYKNLVKLFRELKISFE